MACVETLYLSQVLGENIITLICDEENPLHEGNHIDKFHGVAWQKLCINVPAEV